MKIPDRKFRSFILAPPDYKKKIPPHCDFLPLAGGLYNLLRGSVMGNAREFNLFALTHTYLQSMSKSLSVISRSPVPRSKEYEATN